MRVLFLVLLLSGCANIQDNTTAGDKAVIGGFFTIMIVAAKGLGL